VDLALDALGQHDGAALLGVGRDRRHDLGDGGVRAPLDQAEVELDHLGTQERHEGQRVGVGPDVVESDTDTGRPNPLCEREQAGGIARQGPFGELDDDPDAPAVGSREHRRGGGRDRGRLDVDEESEGGAQTRLDRRLDGARAAQLVELVQASGLPGGVEQLLRHPQRTVDRTAGERLVRDGVAGGDLHDRLEERVDGPTGQDRVELVDQTVDHIAPRSFDGRAAITVRTMGRTGEVLHPVPTRRGDLVSSGRTARIRARVGADLGKTVRRPGHRAPRGVTTIGIPGAYAAGARDLAVIHGRV